MDAEKKQGVVFKFLLSTENKRIKEPLPLTAFGALGAGKNKITKIKMACSLVLLFSYFNV
ncbi:MAG: hypothetical protein A3J65_03615 [Candidatus Buchananbacteria bacterium RIFCSPHIGHO2_02_FULL_45_11b]|uniref:Uncharacterized protein n=4 Tax=Candidatus Buchananiibacteriota TaxID=1817903 RepID=A0A1G1YAV6_9BACT|nr:MAG: hypothetical protein A2663_03355 [Candidatus Buchananbacteria bacterium RIFCSPHIGHO2_01_FULL_46_12]OGY50754.1 MAG: hypothetical protein A3J65_03615 [Candidatus Buchananbacteria bacterium RIFCSPHIGHO2_02_FULL_45_11b]OGY53300.1 MAG: hypothetical protein A3B15_03165 [Candidatus Buchananbacteria bacterium RIFCSPLOWO2_01_FULL_45_31]OGY55747.1 MAG: hypothetical protein A3H67_02510 [Candidatus Buchananbacteria bacterium RIFCSPLOWO2_02_FULL_46_11b]